MFVTYGITIQKKPQSQTITHQQLLTPGYRKQKFSNMTPHARTDIDYGQLTRIVRATSRCPHFSLPLSP